MSGNKYYFVFSPHVRSQYHLGLMLEVVKAIIDSNENAKIIWLGCSGQLLACETNLNHKKHLCCACKSALNNGIRWLDNERVRVVDFNHIKVRSNDTWSGKEFCSIEDLKSYKYRSVDVGMAAASSLITELRDPEPNMLKVRKKVEKHLQSAIYLTDLSYNIFEGYKVDGVLLFNGRTATTRPLLRVANKYNIDVSVIEMAPMKGKYTITKNSYPHDLSYIKGCINKLWSDTEASFQDKKHIAGLWFKKKLAGIDMGWYSFIKGQRKRYIPKEVCDDFVNVAIYISSEDEVAAIDGWENQIYENQLDALRRIFYDCKDMSKLMFFVRVHPNLSGVINSQIIGLKRLNNDYQNVFIVDPNSEVDSYELARRSEVAIVFGSTIGVEIAYMGIPVILIGRSPYEDLGVSINPKSHSEVIDMLNKISKGERLCSPGCYEEGALKYGYYQMEYGLDLKYAVQKDVSKLVMLKDGKEIKVRPSLFWLVINYFFEGVSYFQRPLTGWLRKVY